VLLNLGRKNVRDWGDNFWLTFKDAKVFEAIAFGKHGKIAELPFSVLPRADERE
jgi:hypothetical protein